MTFPYVTRQQAVLMNRGYGYAASGITGAIAAALPADSIVFAMLCDPQAGIANDQSRLRVYPDRLRLAFTTAAAFTTPVTLGRRLALYRAAGPAPTGGAPLVGVKKDTGLGKSSASPASIASVRIATVGALGIAGIVREAEPIATFDLVHVGAAGARTEVVYEFATPQTVPPCLNPGELLVVANPAAMDLGGTWQLAATADWYEQVCGI